MANRYASGDRDGLLALADHVLRRSCWVFALAVCAVPVGLFVANDLLHLDVHFLNLVGWVALISTSTRPAASGPIQATSVVSGPPCGPRSGFSQAEIGRAACGERVWQYV